LLAPVQAEADHPILSFEVVEHAAEKLHQLEVDAMLLQEVALEKFAHGALYVKIHSAQQALSVTIHQAAVAHAVLQIFQRLQDSLSFFLQVRSPDYRGGMRQRTALRGVCADALQNLFTINAGRMNDKAVVICRRGTGA